MVVNGIRVSAGLVAPLAILLGGVAGAAAAPKDPSGTYLTEDGRARVRVERCGPQMANMCGYVVWMKEPMADNQPKLDAKNPDKLKVARPLLGHQLMMGLAAYKDESYTGKIYNNEDGKSYNVTIWTDKDDLKVKGCLIAFLCKTQTWTRANDALPGQLMGVTDTATGPVADAEWKQASTAAPGAPAAGAKPPVANGVKTTATTTAKTPAPAVKAGAKPAPAGAKPTTPAAAAPEPDPDAEPAE